MNWDEFPCWHSQAEWYMESSMEAPGLLLNASPYFLSRCCFSYRLCISQYLLHKWSVSLATETPCISKKEKNLLSRVTLAKPVRQSTIFQIGLSTRRVGCAARSYSGWTDELQHTTWTALLLRCTRPAVSMYLVNRRLLILLFDRYLSIFRGLHSFQPPILIDSSFTPCQATSDQGLQPLHCLFYELPQISIW